MSVVLNSETFDSFIKDNDAVLIDFWATWCGPCRMLAPVIEEIAEETPALKVGKVDVDSCPELAMRYGIMSIPTLLLFKKGELADKSVGYVPKSALLGKLSAIL